MRARFFLLALPVLLAGCDLLGIETSSQIEAKKEAEGRAIGSACRQAVRSIEDCYGQNPRAHKAAVFTGWREMDEYMRQNNIAGMPYSDKKLPMITEKADEVPPPAQQQGQAKAAPAGAVPTAARPTVGTVAPARPTVVPGAATPPARTPTAPATSATPGATGTPAARPATPPRNG